MNARGRGFVQQGGENPFAAHQRRRPQIEPIEVQKIERIVVHARGVPG
jgi:hypothetical protein